MPVLSIKKESDGVLSDENLLGCQEYMEAASCQNRHTYQDNGN